VWSLPVIWQRQRSHQSICHSHKPHATCKLHGSVFYGTGVNAHISFTLREYEFSTFLAPCDLELDPMTFIYKLDPYSLEIDMMCIYKLTIPKLLKVIVWQTDTTKIIYHANLWVVNDRVTHVLTTCLESLCDNGTTESQAHHASDSITFRAPIYSISTLLTCTNTVTRNKTASNVHHFSTSRWEILRHISASNWILYMENITALLYAVVCDGWIPPAYWCTVHRTFFKHSCWTGIYVCLTTGQSPTADYNSEWRKLHAE